jgi:spore maturation protein CgeB
MRIVFLGLSITSSWGNGHATTYRALVRGLANRGHQVTFLERDLPWYAANRDLPNPPYCTTRLYSDLTQLQHACVDDLKRADAVVVGSYVPDGIAVADFVLRINPGLTAFYDIDTPVTLARIESGTDYLTARQIPRYDLYLSFTGGPTLDRLQRRYGARLARPLYCSVDPELYYFEESPESPTYDCGYLGTYSEDRQPILDRLLLSVARRWPDGRFVVAGPQYPAAVQWPANVDRVMHLAPSRHRYFYNTLRYALNITRRDMVAAGYSPSVRLFEAGACGTPIISDTWPGLDTFFAPGREILLSGSGRRTIRHLRQLPDDERREIGLRARMRVLRDHTADRRAAEFEDYLSEGGLRTSAQPSRTGATATTWPVADARPA